MGDLSNGAISTDIERPHTHFSRAGRSLTLNISKMAKGTAVVAMECEYEIVPKLSNGNILNDLD